MLLLVSLTSSALLAPGRGMRLLESTTTTARSPTSRMSQVPTGPAGELKAWLASTSLDFGSVYGLVGLANAAIKAGASLESRAMSAYHDKGGNSSTPLQFATVSGQVRVVKALIDAGASLEALGGKRYTPLQYAAVYGSVDLVKVLIEAGASLEVAGEGKYTPLQLAIAQGNTDTVKVLAEAGASLEVICNRGLTPLQWAIGIHGSISSPDGAIKTPTSAGNSDVTVTPTRDVILALAEAGASLTALGGPGGGLFTPLQYAIGVGNMGAIRALIEAGASLEEARGGGTATFNEQIISVNVEVTPLEFAICEGKVDAMKLLIEAGAPIEAVLCTLDSRRDGLTPLQLAIRGENVGAVEALIEAGASLEAAGESERTALEFAVLEDKGMAETIAEASAWLEVGGRQEISGEVSGASAAVLELILRAEAARKEARESAVQALRDALG